MADPWTRCACAAAALAIGACGTSSGSGTSAGSAGDRGDTGTITRPDEPHPRCVAPEWTGSRALVVLHGAKASGVAVGCDGTTHLAGSAIVRSPDGNADLALLQTLDRSGALGARLTWPFDGTSVTLSLDGTSRRVLAGSEDLGAPSSFVRVLAPDGAIAWEHVVPEAVGARAGVDAAGNVYAATTLRSPGGEVEVALTKFAPDGTIAWRRRPFAGALASVWDVAVSPEGHLFLAGGTGAALEGNVSAGELDAFAARIDPDGALVWVKQLGTARSDVAYGIAVDARGDVALAGSTSGDLAAPNEGSSDGFVAALDPCGNVRWVRQLGTPATDSLEGVAIDALGAVWGVGWTSERVGYALVSRYDQAGDQLWETFVPSFDSARLHDVAIDAAGFAVAAGVTFPFLSEVLVVRIGPDGTL